MLRRFALALVTSTVIAACGTDQYVVAVVHSGGSASGGTRSTGASSLGGYTLVVTNVGNTNGGNGNITGTGGGISASRANVGGGVGSTRETAGGTSQAVSSVPTKGGVSGADRVTITLIEGGNATSANVAGGGTGGVPSIDTQSTSLGGSEGSTTIGFASDSCVCQMKTTPECAPDGATGDQTCTFECVLWPGACDQGCPCTESTQLSYSRGDGEVAMSCSTPDDCDSTMGCSVEFSKFPPYQLSRSSCVVFVPLP